MQPQSSMSLHAAPEATVPGGMPHFFVVGFQRSGTTMLRLMLNAHRDLAIPPETGFLTSVADKLDQLGSLDDPAVRSRVLDMIAAHPKAAKGGFVTPEGRSAAMAKTSYPGMVAQLYESFARRKGKRIWGDKTPAYTEHIGLLAYLFPLARFVHLVRDGRDAALSLKHTSWGTPDIAQSAIRWNLVTQIADEVGLALGPQRYLRIRYDQLVRDPALVLDRICRFLGVAFDPLMLRHHEYAVEEMPKASLAWHRNSVSAVDERRVDRWRTLLSAVEIAIFEQYAGTALARFGFTLVAQPPTFGLKLGKALYYVRLRLRGR